MILKLAWKELRLRWKINLLVLIQLIAVFAACIVCTSLIMWQLRFYSGFEKYLKQDGYLVDSVDFEDPISGIPGSDNKSIEQYMKSAHIITAYDSHAAYYIDSYPLTFITRAMDAAVMEGYRPELKQGRWLKESDSKTDVIEAVITENKYGLKTGDEIKTFNPYADLQIYAEMPEDLTVRIVGELAPGALFFGYSLPPEQELDYRICFQTTDPENPFLLISKEDADTAFKKINAFDGLMSQTGSAFVIYDKDITEEARRFNEEYLRRSAIASIEKLSTINHNSRIYLREQLLQLLPLLIGLLLLTLTSEITTRTISAKMQLQIYAVYRLCGLNVRRCCLISLTSASVIASTAFILSIGGIFFATTFGILNQTVIKIGGRQLLFCLLILLIDIGCTSFLPGRIIRKMSIIDMERTGQ